VFTLLSFQGKLYSSAEDTATNEGNDDMTNLLTQIENAFAKADAKTIANMPAAIVEARALYRVAKEKVLSTRMYSSERYEAVEAKNAMFSKVFQNDFDWGEERHIERAIVSLQKTHQARNARIHKKMADVGIKSIDADNFEVVYGEAFQGWWVIDGFNVQISVVWAGGYNIQRLHHRVLVNVKKAKLAA
jgi:uncharacterized protein YfeS